MFRILLALSITLSPLTAYSQTEKPAAKNKDQVFGFDPSKNPKELPELIDYRRCQAGKPCLCYGYSNLETLKKFYRAASDCNVRLEHSQKTVADLQKFGKDKEPQWFQDPYVIVGGVAVSFAVGSIVTWALLK